VLHGFDPGIADDSSWSGVIERLQARGILVMAPANPLRGISADSAYLSKDSVLNSASLPHQYPAGAGTATESSIDPAKARDAFAADLSDAQAALIAATQTSLPPGFHAWR
jgi:hypothetical protein